MNKAIILMMILLAASALAADEAKYDENKPSNYNKDDFYETEPVENWNVEYIPEDKVNDLSGDQLRYIEDKMNNDQLGSLKSENIKKIIGQVDHQQLGAMNPDEIGNLGSDAAHKYFDQKLKDGYNPKNPNERALLKKIESFQSVDMDSFADTDGAEFGNDEGGNYVKTPNGKVYLDVPAHVKQTPEGIVVDGAVRLTNGQLHVQQYDGQKEYRMVGFETECDLMHYGEYAGVSLSSGKYGMEVPTIYHGMPEDPDEDYVAFTDDTLRAGGSGYKITAHEDNGFSNFEAYPGPGAKDGFTLNYPEGDVNMHITQLSVNYFADPDPDDIVGQNQRKGFQILPFESYELGAGDTTVTSDDGGKTWKVDDGSSWWTKIWQKAKDKVNDWLGRNGPLTDEEAGEEIEELLGLAEDGQSDLDDGTVTFWAEKYGPEDLQTVTDHEKFDKLPDSAQTIITKVRDRKQKGKNLVEE